MHRFKNILVVNEPAQGAGHALARAIRLAKTNEAQLTIVSIARGIPRNLVSVQRALLRLQQQQLQELANKVDAEGVSVNTTNTGWHAFFGDHTECDTQQP